VLDIKDLPASDKEVEQALQLPTRPAVEEIKEAEEAENQLISKLQQQEQARPDFSKGYQGLPSPKETPEPDQSDQNDQSDQAEDASSSMPRGWQPIEEDKEAPNRVSNNAPRKKEINSQLNQGNIISRKRTRGWLGAYVTSFINSIRDPPKQRLHREQLPLLLKR
jgi:hypothetical protein